MAIEKGFDRFRSFAERYVIERAATFTKGKEQEEAWAATLDARSIYRGIERVSHDAEPEQDAQQAGVSSSTSHPGVTGAMHPAHFPSYKESGLTPQDYHKLMTSLRPPIMSPIQTSDEAANDDHARVIMQHEASMLNRGAFVEKVLRTFSPNRKGAKYVP